MIYQFFILILLSSHTLFSNSVYDSLLQQLGKNFENNQDPYAQEYQNTDELVRFPELLQKDGPYWLIDNYREMRWSKKIPKDGLKYKFYKHISPKWTSALIDVSKLKKVSLYILNFHVGFGEASFPVGHVQMYYEFEEGGVMTPAGSTNNLVHSFEAYLDYSQDWNPVTGIKDVYESVILLGSYKDSIAKSLTRFDEIKIYELKITEQQKKILLENSLKLALDRKQLKEKFYHTTRNSCATNQITLLNDILPVEQKVKEWRSIFGKRIFRTFGTILPNRISRRLQKKFLIVKDSKRVERDLEQHYLSITK
ncbi:DUF4105 domain-containing protein [bacterium]|nr:DUF4105 domain-containing protein [bacterium]